MTERDGWKHDNEGWYVDPAADPDDPAPDPAAPSASPAATANPYRALPPRTPLEDTVAEVDSLPQPEEPAGDPNRQDAVRLGLMGGAG